jgi:hypothetical protein
MGRKLPLHFVKKDELVASLEGDKEELKKLGKDVLVWKAFEENLISKEQRDASFIRRSSTIPCYLYTHIIDPAIRERIEAYVQAYSMLYTRGAYLANLLVLSIPNVPNLPRNEIPNQIVPIPEILWKDTEFKKVFYPERWLNKGSPVNPLIQQTLQQYQVDLDRLLPASIGLCDTGWDNALNQMASMYLGNVKVMMLTPLRNNIYKYLTEKTYEDETSPTEVMKACFYPLRPSTGISEEAYEWATRMRDFLGIPIDKSYFQVDELNDLNDKTWTIHLWLQDGTSRLPVSPLGRKYAYLDAKIVRALLPAKIKNEMLKTTAEHVGTDIQKLLGLTSKCFNKRRDKIRKQLKKRYKNNTNKQRLYKKWSKIGHSCLPANAEIDSVTTDGVGLRLSLKFIPRSPNPQNPAEKICPLDAFKIGEDDGRVNLAATANEDGGVHMIKRSSFYKHLRDKKFKRWERLRMTGTAWGGAIAQIAQAGGFSNTDLAVWTMSLAVTAQHINILRQEQLIDKTRALNRMRRFRWKKSFLHQSWKKVLTPGLSKGPTKHIVLGVGNAKFACTGRGEKAVPTTALSKSLHDLVKMWDMDDRIHISPQDEYNTTKCCHRCSQIMLPTYRPDGTENLRYRLCSHCAASTGGKRRNRDVNAAKNMLTLVDRELQGLPRPAHLVCPWH